MAIFQFNLIPPFGIPSFTATKIYYGSQDFLVLKSADSFGGFREMPMYDKPVPEFSLLH